MNTINRTILIVIPKKPYLDWVNSLETDENVLDTGAEHHSAYLISEKYDEFNNMGFSCRDPFWNYSALELQSFWSGVESNGSSDRIINSGVNPFSTQLHIRFT